MLDAFGEVVIAGLRPKIPELLKKYYETNPDNADADLAAAIGRDARDPGAANVIGSGAKLPPQRSLNEAFAAYGGPVLVPQGSLDAVTGPERVARGVLLAVRRGELSHFVPRRASRGDDTDA